MKNFPYLDEFGNMGIRRGDTLNIVLTLFDDDGVTPVDLSDCAATWQVRATADYAAVILEAKTTDSTLILGGTAGTITFAIPAATTAPLAVASGIVHELQITYSDDTTVETLLSGAFEIAADVVR